MSPKKEKACQDDRLGNLILVDKKRLAKELSDFQSSVKSKEEVEAVADVFFEQMCRLNGVK